VDHRVLCITIFGAQRTQDFTRRTQKGRYLLLDLSGAISLAKAPATFAKISLH